METNAERNDRAPLPFHLTSFVGREPELADVCRLSSDHRLVTLTGSGGCGKTRLAAEAAVRRAPAEGSPIWVELGTVGDSGATTRALVKALGLQESPGQPSLGLISRTIGNRGELLVLDNCEHLIDTVGALVTELLRRCPALRVIVTSREPLGILGEITYRVPSLTVPGSDVTPTADAIARTDGVRLFVDRATAIRPNFRLTDDNAPAIAAICRRLDGIALAIELAAARTRAMSVEDIEAGLDDRFRLLTGGARTAVPRHRTLHASIAWSHALLTPAEKALLRRVSVFPGGFTLDGAERVGVGDDVRPIDVLELLTHLVDRSLIHLTEPAGETRYRMLESIREFAQTQLADHPGESQTARDRHLEHMLDFARRAAERLESEEVFAWLERVDHEYDNIVAARAWAEQRDRPDAITLTTGLATYCRTRGHEAAKALSLLPRAVDDDTLPPITRATAGLLLAQLTYLQWDMPELERRSHQAAAFASEAGSDAIAARALVWAGRAAAHQFRIDDAREAFRRALGLAGECGDMIARAGALNGTAEIFLATGDWQQSAPLFAEGLEAARAAHDILGIADALHYSFVVNAVLGRIDEAEAAAREGLDLAARLRDQPRRATFGSHCAYVAAVKGELDEARRTLEWCLELAELSPSPFPVGFWRNARIELARSENDPATALAEARLAADIASLAQIHAPACQLYAFAAEAAALLGDQEGAAELTERSWDERRACGAALPMAPWAEAVAAFARGDLDVAEDRAATALTDATDLQLLPHAVASLEMIGRVAAANGGAAEAARLLGASEAGWRHLNRIRPGTMTDAFEDAIRRCRETLSDETFDEAWTAGLALGLGEAAAYATRGRGERKRPTAGWASLTPTENDVVALVADGLTNAAIGARLFISVATVKTHLSHVYTKVGIGSRVELATEYKRRNA